jgi:hypothetical protein
VPLTFGLWGAGEAEGTSDGALPSPDSSFGAVVGVAVVSLLGTLLIPLLGDLLGILLRPLFGDLVGGLLTS